MDWTPVIFGALAGGAASLLTQWLNRRGGQIRALHNAHAVQLTTKRAELFEQLLTVISDIHDGSIHLAVQAQVEFQTNGDGV